MKRLFVWPGGKSREFHKVESVSKLYDKKVFAEPFLGSGFTFLNLDDYDEYYINDISKEVINLFKNIKSQNKIFISTLEMHIKAWEMKDIKDMCDHYSNEDIKQYKDYYFKKWGNNKLSRETLTKMLYFNYIRYRYNEKLIENIYDSQMAADFMFLRQYSFSGMIRYSSIGKYNIPYGGFRYNNRTLVEKLELITSKELKNKMKKTKIFNEDFRVFLKRIPDNAFVFLDPPYDSEFNSYTDDDFTFDDQKDLSKLIRESNFTSYMIMLKTDLIERLYKDKIFQKEYSPYSYGINIKNRQELKTRVKHVYVIKE